MRLVGGSCRNRRRARAPGRRRGASPYIRYGVQDDAWIRSGPGTLEQRLDRLESLGVDLVRLNLRWSDVEPRRGAFDWSGYDAVLAGLRDREIETVLTLYSTPAWANGGRGTNWAPTSGATFATFARRTAAALPVREALADLERAEPAAVAAADDAGDLRDSAS